MIRSLDQVGPNHYRVPGSVPIDVFANEAILRTFGEAVFQQASNTAAIPGVESVALMPDAHSGYGAPIGAVVATKKTIIPMVAGYDISCGMSFLQTSMTTEQLADWRVRRGVIQAIERRIALGKEKAITRMTQDRFERILREGAESYPPEIRDRLERVKLESSAELSPRARQRGVETVGSVGSGNHFIEIQAVTVHDESLAQTFGVRNGVGVMLHTGSRGLGHQVASEFLAELQMQGRQVARDRELVFMEADSDEGRRYLDAMGAAANVAIVNRLLILTEVAEVLEEQFHASTHVVYDISHNLIQQEELDGQRHWIHRKGATRAFPAGHPGQASRWKPTGHPIITPGSMGTASHIQVALPGARASLYSINHGAGRLLSRGAANRTLKQADADKWLADRDILVNTRHVPLDESAAVYKDIDQVIDSISGAGLARIVASCRPMAVIKGA
ncbi:MAG TPA: RtcB family protein [Candidatus Dormibacteraeota bacterium]|nr:RtcB family protein [Candidatus Dormibacteraeota bacterium]